MEMAGLEFLDHAVDSFALRRMEDPPASETEGDVVGAVGIAVRDEVARTQLVGRDGPAGVLLLVGVAWDEPPEPAVRHVDESGTVDPRVRQAAPEIRRAEVGASNVDRRARRSLRQGASISSIALLSLNLSRYHGVLRSSVTAQANSAVGSRRAGRTGVKLLRGINGR